MQNHINELFRAVNREFLGTYIMTAAGTRPMEPGRTAFNLRESKLGTRKVAQVNDWGTDAGQLPVLGYWVPQGDSCLVRARPGANEYVFTPDFNGCSLLVDQIDAEHYRVYHVTGGGNYLTQEYTNSPHGHGMGLAGALTFPDYGTKGRDGCPCGFAFMRFEQGRWWIYYQRQSGAALGVPLGGTEILMPPQGGKAILGGGRIPVADLTVEIPRRFTRHGDTEGEHVPAGFDLSRQRRMLPAEDYW